MTTRRWLVLSFFASALALIVVGANGGDRYSVGPTVPVSGTILVKDKPLRLRANAFARVWFHPDASKGNHCPQVASGDGRRQRLSALELAEHESFRSLHRGGLHFAFADGSVRFIHDSIALPVYRGLATIQGTEVVALP